MNFSSMDYFVVLARERSFTRAAEQLHITQQSLSAHIAGLEKELGCQLLVRSVPLKLTYAGEVFLRYAADFQSAQTAMQREFSDISRNQKGVLRVGAAATRGHSLLPPAISRFQELYPRIRVELTEAANDVLCQRLQQGRLDLAIADFPPSLPGVQLRDLYREETVLYIHRRLFASVYGDEAPRREQQFRSGDFSALGECPFVMGSPEDIDGRIGRSFLQSAGVGQPEIRAVSHNVGMLLALCSRGIGACFCPGNLARFMLTGSRREELIGFPLPEETRYWIRFGYPAQSYQWSVIDAFMGCVESATVGKADEAEP